VEDVPVQDSFHILATTSLADERTRVLKQGDTFAVFDHFGDVVGHGLGEQGLYHQGTRFLSRLELRLAGSRPLFLSSTVKKGNDLLLVDLTNPDIPLPTDGVLPHGTVHLFRAKFLWNGSCQERVRVSNHGLAALRLTLSLHFAADFADVFEVRGTRRERRGRTLDPEVGPGRVVLGYLGLDGVVRRTRLEFSPPGSEASATEVRFELRLEPQSSETVSVAVACDDERGAPALVSYEASLSAAQAAQARRSLDRCRIRTSNEPFDEWLDRSWADLNMMITDTPHGPYPYAGVPWFSTPFGRDGIITAMETLWLDPGVARGVLSYLAATQATEVDPERDAEPGKILHETREGEMAALREVPFGRYYGSVDATPLFVMLAAAYYGRTGDRRLIESLWPNVEAALLWLDRYGDVDGDGFVEYRRQSSTGLVHQGWKDSGDAVFHADGRLAEGPIALCEVQAYAYAARLGAARLATVLGHLERAAELQRRADELRSSFEERFWSEELSTYVLALDGRKRPCRVRTSNAGHGLFAGIAGRERAQLTAATLMDDASFSGWGVRTVAASELRYNPMSYHNGSVWPHDNALVACGLGRYGRKRDVLRILDGLFDASQFVELRRMPELFCGFKRRPGEGPTLYPVACAPQSWSAGAVFLLLQAALGLSIDAPGQQIVFSRPLLPEFLGTVHIDGLRAGAATVDLVLHRHGEDVGITVARREGDVEIVDVK
jgi:glycogen debranching enzyme